MMRRLYHHNWVVAALLMLLSFQLKGEEQTVVKLFNDNLSAWASSKQISHLYSMENLCSQSPAFRIGNSLMTSLADKNGLAKSDTYNWDSYIACLQKEIDNGVSISLSSIKAVPDEYIEVNYPGVRYVACNLKVNGAINMELHDLFILKDDKIAKITDYIERKDDKTGKKTIEVDYIALAKAAFADNNYQRCYDLYKQGALKAIDKRGYKNESDVIPYVESCVALGKWDDAMHGITDNHRFINRNYWANGVKWTLSTEDLKSWNPAKKPLMDEIFHRLCLHYSGSLDKFKQSPLVKHISNRTNTTVDQLVKQVADYLWNDRNSWVEKTVGVSRAAEFGHPDAQRELGHLYLTGYDNSKDRNSPPTDIIPRDTIQAVKWFDRAARQGDTQSAVIAAAHYLNSRNYPQAFSLYKLNEGKCSYATDFGLGLCYYYGLGVAQNLPLALNHLLEAEDWHKDTPYLIGQIYLKSSNPLAIKYLEKILSRSGVNPAIKRETLLILADCYAKGKCGLTIDSTKASQLKQQAERLPRQDNQYIKNHLVSLTHKYD